MSTLASTSASSSLDAKRAKLAARLHQASSRPQSVRASFGQERLWFLDQLHPGTPLYNIPMLVRLTGRLNFGALKSAFNALVSRHEALRTGFSCVDGTPMQFIEPRSSFELQFLDLEGNPNPQDEAATYIKAIINEAFDLAREPLLRATVLRLKPDEHLLVLTLHHIVADEWSLKVLFRELSYVYECSIQGEQITLQPLPIQYADYAVWQRTWLSGKNFDDLLAYWKDQLSGNPPVVELLPDHSREAAPCFQGTEISRRLPQKLSEDLKALAAQREVTLFMLLLAGFKALLHRYTGQEDLLLASPIAGRNRAETENLIGFFVNTLLLRSNAGGDPPFCEFLARVRRVTLGAYEHQELPFEKLIEHLQPERSLAHLPYSKVMFLVQNQLLEEMELPGLRLEFQELTTDTSKFELTVVAQETRQGLVLRAQYNTALFEAGTIDRLLRYFETLLEGIVANPAQRLSQLPLLTAAERYQLLVEWNRTQTPYPADQCIHRVFETKAAETPEGTALVFGEYQLTYQELNTRANQLAHYLRQLKVGPEVPVALMVERSREMVIGMLGILKAGGAYVPLDPAYPRERLAFMLADSGAPVVLTQQRLIALLPPQAVRVIALDTDWELINAQSRENPAISTGPDSLAYLMYTSGSTGQPKGVAVVHRAVNRLVLNTNYIRFNATDRIAQLSNISFDAATFEIWGALLNGGQLVGIGQEVVLSPKAFGREIQARGITAMFLTAALFNQLASEAPGSLRTVRTVIAGGEALDPKWVLAVLKHQPPQRLVNGYGPTENTTFTCCGLVSELSAEAGNVPIGRPIANTQVYILDAHLNPVPIGVPGELYTGGDGLARGYWNRPELTAEKFVKNPYESAGRLLYKTGDLARYLPDGRIEFLGRIDQQVKIRGFRIELGEIENALAKHTGVRDCVVILDGTGARTKRLVAYVVPTNQPTPNTSELRKFLGEKLPDFMIPSAFIALARLPLTANGKVDRKALPAPECARPDLEKQYTAARNPEEAQLVTIWENVLGVRPIGIEDKFFELGGHSLLAVKLLGQIEKAFGKKLRLATIFQAPTVAQLAAILREEAGEARPTSIIEIQPQGRQRPLFLVHGAGGGMFWGYVNLSRHLGLNQPIYGFKSRGLDGFEEFPCLEDMAAHYLADLRRIQPEGPYHIGGYCFGGIVAYEMACQLAQQDQQVALLALFNCAPPNSRYTRIPWTPKWALRLLRNLGYWVTYALSWTPSQRREFVRWKLRLAKKRFEKLRQRAGTQSVAVQAGDLVDLSSFTQDERKVWEAHIRALVKYEPRSFAGQLHLFRTSGHALWCSFDPDYGWGDLAKGGVEVTVVPGAHEKILKEPFVAVLADKLRAVLGRIQDVAKSPEPGIQHNSQPSISSRNEPEIQHDGSGAVAPEQQPSNRVPLIGATSVISGPRVAFPVESTYAQQFAIQAVRNPDGCAVSMNGEEMTYAELDRRANQWAHYLQSVGVGPEVLVGVCLPRSVDLMVALLAVLKAGGAYLPLDTSYPSQRLAYMLRDSKSTSLLSHRGLLKELEIECAARIDLDAPELLSRIAQFPRTPPVSAATADSLAYVIYTSGSTGEPKGVEITHRSLLNHNFAIANAYELGPLERVLQFAPISFDISAEEIFPTWLSAGTLVLRPPGRGYAPEQFLDYAAREKVTVLNLPTAYWHELTGFLDSKGRGLPESVRLVVIGGEPPSETDWRRWRQFAPKGVRLLNAYGTTETTITSTLYVSNSERDSLPIGQPIANTQAFILDEARRPVPIGSNGELYIGGAGVARGYLHRPGLTADHFIRNPLPGHDTNERLYRTGDLARLNADGNIEFLGRLDEQVKIRGYRVELGEIEATLLAHPEVKNTAVVVREDLPGTKRLVAYIVPKETPPGLNLLLTFLKARLPDYMLPSAFVSVPALPMTPAGKVDRCALPAPGNGRPLLDREYARPQSPVQVQVAKIWSEVLGLEPIGLHDNFFDLGGHSLLAIQVLSRLREQLRLEISLEQLFAHPTVSGVAALVSEITAQPAAQAAARYSAGTRQMPLSARQRRLWLLEQFHLTCSPFNRPVALRLVGPLEVEALRKALTLLAARHDALRAVFPVAGGEPSQSICAPTEVTLQVLNLENVPEAQREEAATTSMAQAARSPYILKEPVLRPLLLRLGPQEHRLLLLLHEITVDSRSVNLLLKELALLYETVSDSCHPLLQELIAYDELTGLEAGSPAEQEEDWNYWQRQLAAVSDALDLPADRPRPAEHSGAGARMPVVVQFETLQMLEKLAAQAGCSTFSVLLAAFASVLHRYTSNSEVVIGSVVSAEPGEKACQTIANFENPVALRCNLEDDPTFLDLLKRAETVWTQAKIHSRLPFAELVDRLAPERKTSYTRLFQTAFLFQPEPLPATCAGGVSFTPIDLDNQTAKLDLSLRLAKDAFGLSGWFEYSADLFDSERIKRIAGHFVHLLSKAVVLPETRVSSLPLLTDPEAGQLVSEWNRTEMGYPKDDTIVSLFLEQAARTPDAEAIVWGAERVTYRQLRQRALQVAAELSRLGITSEKLVGICLERSPDMIAAMLGTLLAGGAYVPLDPAYPAERLGFIMEDAQAQVLLTQRKFFTLLTAPKAKLIVVDELGLEKNSQGGITPDLVLPQASNLAYVIYTSGSTGRPKGVALEHRNAAAFIHWARSVFNADELSGVLASTSICFDLSIFEIFVPLTSGGRVILAENALALPTLRAASEVTLVNTVPSAIRELLRLKGVPSSVRTVNLAGEPLAASLVDQIYAETSAQKVYDLYGPSETTTYSTFALRQPGEPATIGRPLANEQVYVLDSHLQPVGIGVPGELFIGGDGLARGYLNRPELTAEKFIPHPFKSGARVYRTGDLARWRADANLEYIGRRDHQVKIRGFRIELGEIESVLKAQPGVREAVVVAREEQPGDKRLVAYLVAASETAVSVEQLRERLRSRLPEYMIPPDFVFLKELPLTPNGKLDRKALPAPQRERRPERPMTQPHTVEQEEVLAIWRQVLGLEHIGVRDNFFDLGGHSLLATQVISRMRELFHVELPLAAFFAAPTIEALASGLESGAWISHDRSIGPHRVERNQPHPLSFVQERLWFLNQLEPGSHAYHVPMALRLEGELNLEALRRALQQIVCRHEALRTTLPYKDGRLIQEIAPDLTPPVDTSDISNVPSEEQGTRIREWLAGLAQKPFDLTCGPLLRCAVLRLAEREHIFMVVMHHTISDGWSLSLFFQELSSLYNAFAAGAPAPALSELPLQYVDFAHWQRDSMQGAALESEAGYWRNKLASAPARIELPADSDLPASPEGKAGRSTILLEAQLVQAMNRMGQAQGCTPFMLLMSALAITLHKWCEQRDLVIGTVVAGRTRREFENVFGCFMNFLPIRARLREEMSAEEALAHVRAAVLEGQTHQGCPFEKMVEAVNPERRLNQNPLYNVALLVQNFPSEPFRSESLRSSAVPVPMEDALLDLRFEAERSGTSLGLSCEYRVELFAKKTVDHLLAAMVDALRVLLTRSETKLQEYQLCEELIQQRKASRSKSDRQALAVAATFTAEPLAEPLTYWLKELQLTANIEFAPYNQVFQQLLTPGSLLTGNVRGLNVILLRLEDWQQATASKVSSAGQNLANDLGRNLEEFIAAIKTASVQGSVPYLVGLCPPSTAALADPARAELLAEQEALLVKRLNALSGVYVLTYEELQSWYPVANYNDATSDEIGHIPYNPTFFSALATGIARKFHALQRSPCKVIVLDCDHTLWSGVCGEDGPTGLGFEPHRTALHDFALAQKQQGKLLCLCSKNNEEDVWQVFQQRPEMSLRREHLTSWRINWQPKSENIKALARELGLGLDSFVLLDDNPVECAEVEAACPEVIALQLPNDPVMLPQFLNHCWVFDQLKVTTADRRRTELYHEQQQREELRTSSTSLANFIAGLELKIVNEPMLQEQVERVAQLTQRTNQFNTTSLRRSEPELLKLAAAGDVLAVQVSDRFGDYGLVGVMVCQICDNALKVDSFLLSCRVLGRGVEYNMLARAGELARGRELGWVDVHVVPSAKNKPALDFLDGIGKQFRQPLNGGYVFRFPAGFAADVAFCPASTPTGPMVASDAPAAGLAAASVKKFTRCREIALEANDPETIHRRIEERRTSRSAARGAYAAPHSEVERRLCDLWKDLLKVEPIGVLDDFFDLGGHSLLAVRLFAEIERLFGRKLPLVTLFQAPTIQQLAELLSQKPVAQAHPLLVPLQPRGSGAPLFLVHGAGGDVLWGYANLVNYLSKEQPVYGIKSRGQAGLDEPASLEEMAARYLDAVRAFQPQGPYYLGGYCFGGNVAYEMARQLELQGESVALVALLDSAPANAGYESMKWWRPDFMVRFMRNFAHWSQDFAALKSNERRNFVLRKFRALGRKVTRRLQGRGGAELVDIEEVIEPSHFAANELRLWQAHLEALARHVERPFGGKVTLLRTRGQPLFCSLEEDFCWGRLALGGVVVKSIPGSHENIFLEPNVRSLAAELAEALAQTQNQ
jgi:amino acid adenylation domain-containing protein/FkbH-like protein